MLKNIYISYNYGINVKDDAHWIITTESVRTQYICLWDKYHNDLTYKMKDPRNDKKDVKGWKVCTLYKCLFGLFDQWDHTPDKNL